ncbi:Parasporal protein [Sporosarcina sp. P21c]|nr:Parasporal protein [Sporosarcina sp. P16a]PIC90200.1 Parasporal protein [Sporosarcina sp. P21c]PIC92709.1 Parasporal protein [Sporosarcina sp. P25]
MKNSCSIVFLFLENKMKLYTLTYVYTANKYIKTLKDRGDQTMKKKLLGGLCALLLACSLPLSAAHAESSQPFKDVPPSKHFADAVNELAERNIIGGYPDGTFKPGNSITRGQAAAIIAKMRGLDTSDVKGQKFKDVPASHGFYKAIVKMAEEGMIGGYPDGSFKPNEPIKRKNMAAILVKAFDLPRSVDVKNPFKGEVGITNDVLVIYQLGITSGTSPTTFSPNASITRGQAAKMLAATEQVMMKNAVTVEVGDLGWDTIESILTDEVNPGVFRAVKGKKDGMQDQVQLIPIKEGKGGFVIAGRAGNEWMYQKYYVHVKKEGSDLRLTLEKTDDSLPTEVALNTKYKTVENIALAKVDGEKISDNVKIERNEYNFTYIMLEKPGDYIATIRFANGEEVRYSVTAFEVKDSFFYGAYAMEIGPAD